MKKTVEIEYVGIEDLHEILNDATEVMAKGHYVSIEAVNYVRDEKEIRVSVYIMVGGFEYERPYDYKYGFYLSEDADDVKAMTACKNTLKNLMMEV